MCEKNRFLGQIIFCFSLLLWVSACSEALPKSTPEEQFGDAMVSAEKAAQQAAEHAAAARVEIERAEQLLAEVKLLEARLQAAERRCDEKLDRAIALEKSQQKMFRDRAANERARAKRAAEEAAARKAAEEAEKLKKESGPEYSSSDAPL